MPRPTNTHQSIAQQMKEDLAAYYAKINKREGQPMSKYETLHVVQGDFGFGWEDVTASDEAKEAINDLHAYRENDPDHAYRKIQRREKTHE